jgi:hypothetical protein
MYLVTHEASVVFPAQTVPLLLRPLCWAIAAPPLLPPARCRRGGRRGRRVVGVVVAVVVAAVPVRVQGAVDGGSGRVDVEAGALGGAERGDGRRPRGRGGVRRRRGRVPRRPPPAATAATAGAIAIATVGHGGGVRAVHRLEGVCPRLAPFLRLVLLRGVRLRGGVEATDGAFRLPRPGTAAVAQPLRGRRQRLRDGEQDSSETSFTR